MSNVAGQATAFMAITPILPGNEPALKAYLDALPQGGSPFERLPGTHFARWVILTDWVNDHAQPHEDHLKSSHLIFTSNFDGPLDRYLEELSAELAPEAPMIWGRCIGCPQPAAGAPLKAYLLHNKVNTGFFVAAYPHSTVSDVKAALAIRARLIDFATQAQGKGPDDLRDDFNDEFGQT